MTCVQKEGAEDNNMHVYTIISISDDLWNEIKNIFPKEKPPKTVGYQLNHIEKYLMEFSTFLEQDVSGRCDQENTVLALYQSTEVQGME
jgi:hypothetical protein